MRLSEALFGGQSGALARGAPRPPDVCVLEDDPEAAELAVEICSELGLRAASYSAPTPFLAAMVHRPRLIVLDWQLEHELGAAAFMGIRHRDGRVPIVCWTGTPRELLPAMVVADPATLVVDKSDGLEAFESAVSWALHDGRQLPNN